MIPPWALNQNFKKSALRFFPTDFNDVCEEKLQKKLQEKFGMNNTLLGLCQEILLR